MVSIARLSRGLRESATTSRYAGCLVAPTRVRRMRTAMCLLLLPWAIDEAGVLVSLDGDDRMHLVSAAADGAGGDQRVERTEERLDLEVVLRLPVRRSAGHRA